ncbi:23860_t:CDS:1, partial [Racocetra persica]
MTWNTSAHRKSKSTRTKYTTHKSTHLHQPTKTKHQTPTPTGIPCCQPGSPGFKTSGQIHVFFPLVEIIENTTAEECCKSCFNKSNCFEWVFTPNLNRCLMSTDENTCNNILMVPINNSPFSHGGIMRCDTD